MVWSVLGQRADSIPSSICISQEPYGYSPIWNPSFAGFTLSRSPRFLPIWIHPFSGRYVVQEPCRYLPIWDHSITGHYLDSWFMRTSDGIYSYLFCPNHLFWVHMVYWNLYGLRHNIAGIPGIYGVRMVLAITQPVYNISTVSLYGPSHIHNRYI